MFGAATFIYYSGTRLRRLIMIFSGFSFLIFLRGFSFFNFFLRAFLFLIFFAGFLNYSIRFSIRVYLCI